MLRFFQSYITPIFLGFMFGSLIFILSHIQLLGDLFANITIPFQGSDAGLNVDIKNAEIVSEQHDNEGVNKIVQILSGVFFVLKAVLGIIVVFWIVYAGVFIVAGSAEEEKVTTGRKMIQFSILGLAAMLLIEPLVLNIFYGGGDISVTTSGIGDIEKSTTNFRSEVSGIMDFVKTILIFIAMAYIIKSGSKMILSYGDDESLSSAKGIFMPMFFGFLLIIFNEIFIDQVFYNVILDGGTNTVSFQLGDSSGVSIFVQNIVGFLQYIFSFLIVIFVGFAVYGGFLLMTSLGEDEKLESGKKILTNSLIGIIIIASSYLLTWSLVNFDNAAIG